MAWDEEVDIAICSCILTAVATLIMVAKVYAARLHPSEAMETVRSKGLAAIEFLRQHWVKPLEAVSQDVSGFHAALEQVTQTISQLKVS